MKLYVAHLEEELKQRKLVEMAKGIPKQEKVITEIEAPAEIAQKHRHKKRRPRVLVSSLAAIAMVIATFPLSEYQAYIDLGTPRAVASLCRWIAPMSQPSLVVKWGTNVRSGPGKEFPVGLVLKAGAGIVPRGSHGDWVFFQRNSTTYGWVHRCKVA